MNISIQLAVVAVAACLCLVEGTPDGRMVRSKQQRPTRGFKNVEMMTARGFGKRDQPHTRNEHLYEYKNLRKYNPKTSLMVANDFGKRSGNDDNVEEVYGMDNIWEMLEGSADREGQDINDEKTPESIPVDWFTSEMLNNPDLARAVVRKFIDLNQDSVLSSDELLRNTV